MRKSSQSGQIVLISLLVLTIATTVGLSLLSRTTTDVALTAELEESSRAFSAAEAGIEQILKTGVATGAQVLTSGVTYDASVTDIRPGIGAYAFPAKTQEEATETVWLAEHDSDGMLAETPTYTAPSIDVCWGSETATPALSVAIFYKSGASYRVGRVAADPDDARRVTNNFSVPTATTGGCGDGSTIYRQTITFASFSPAINPASDVLLMLRVRPIYSDAQLAVSATQTLAQQGATVSSSGATATGTTRKIVVNQRYRAASSIFESAIYSQSTFEK